MNARAGRAPPDDAGIVGVVEELTDRYGPLPEPAQRLVAVARLRLVCRSYGVTEVAATGSGSPTTIRISPLTLPDSAQLRLKRVYPGASYRATTSTVTVPIPRSGSGVGAPRIRDLQLVQMVADLLRALDGQPQGELDITTFTPAGSAKGERR